MAYDQLANALASSGASYTPRKRTHTDALIRSLMSGASSARGPWSALGNVLGLAIAKGGEGRLDEQEAAQRRATMEAQSEYLGGEWTPDALARAMAQPGIDPSALMAGAKDFQSMFPRQKPADRKYLKGADGYNYYQDTGERVLPGVEQAPDLPALAKEYEWAQSQGFEGTPQEWVDAKRAPGTVVNVGTQGRKASPGYQWVDETQTEMEPIPGGPADKLSVDQAKKTATADSIGNAIGILEGIGADGRPLFEHLSNPIDTVNPTSWGRMPITSAPIRHSKCCHR